MQVSETGFLIDGGYGMLVTQVCQANELQYYYRDIIMGVVTFWNILAESRVP